MLILVHFYIQLVEQVKRCASDAYKATHPNIPHGDSIEKTRKSAGGMPIRPLTPKLRGLIDYSYIYILYLSYSSTSVNCFGNTIVNG